MHALLVVLAFAVDPPINAIVGDASVELGYVRADASEDARIAGHLRFAHDRLAAIDTSSWPAPRRAARAKNLARLAAYIDAGRFPRNDDHPDARRPTFVDQRGAICAVGALFAADRGRAAAERIAASYKYAFIPDIHDAELALWQRTSGLSLRELAIVQPEYRSEPAMKGEAWAPPALLDRMLPGANRLGLTTELFDGGVGLDLHGQLRWPGIPEVFGYAALPLAIAEPFSTTAAAGAAMPASRDTLLGNSELGVYLAGSHLLMKLGAVVPTGSETRPRAIGARVEDAVLGMSRAAGGRAGLSYLRALTEEHCGACSFQTMTRLRLDVGYDVVETLGDRAWHAIPRAGLGLSYGSQRGVVLIEAAIARAPDPIGDPHLRWSTGITGRAMTIHGGDRFHVDVALTAAAVHDITGWGGTLALELAYVREGAE